MTPRKHAELIKAWADGAEIQQKLGHSGDWIDSFHPSWVASMEYRIKPVPKADYVRKGDIVFYYSMEAIPVNVTIDGETGEAKKVEIVK